MEINGDTFKVKNEWFNQQSFSELFIPAFCVTICKYQGSDINEPHNIYDANKMDKKQFYTD